MTYGTPRRQEKLGTNYTALLEELEQGLESGGDSYTCETSSFPSSLPSFTSTLSPLTRSHPARLVDSDAKSDFKYGASRGVFSTPSFYLNQVPVFGTGQHAEGTLAAFSLQDWQGVLDPILKE